MSVHIVGSGGFVGRHLVAGLSHLFDVRRISSSGRADAVKLDLADPAKFNYATVLANDVVVVTAAISSPDICAKDPGRARSINVDGTRAFIAAVLARGARVIFLSSDTVFGEREAEFDEDAALAPFGAYAEMKAEVERHFAAHPAVKRFRLSYVVAADDKFTSYLVDNAKSGAASEIYDPLLRRAVAITDIVDAVAALSTNWECLSASAVNLAGPDLLSRVDLVHALRSASGANLDYRVVIPEDKFYAARPRTINMGTRFLAGLLGREPTPVRDAYTRWFSRGLPRT